MKASARGRLLRGRTHGALALEYVAFCPARASEDAPLLVAVHGYSRNAAEQVERFLPVCEAAGAVLVAPHFDVERFRDYQQLGGARGARADAALDAVLAELRAAFGLLLGRVTLFGFSGGGQFVHRYALAYPKRLTNAVIAAPGWYTFPGRELAYPLGTRGARRRLGVRMRAEAFTQVPITVAVGEHDDDEHAENLRRERKLDRQQGKSRLERATRWVAAMQEAALAAGGRSRVRLQLLPNAGHSFGECMENGLAALVAEQLAAPTRSAGAERKRLAQLS
jgi:pimeloyl-ACP methyl ester carboxylesterase